MSGSPQQPARHLLRHRLRQCDASAPDGEVHWARHLWLWLSLIAVGIAIVFFSSRLRHVVVSGHAARTRCSRYWVATATTEAVPASVRATARAAARVVPSRAVG